MSKQSGLRWSQAQYDAYQVKRGVKAAIVETHNLIAEKPRSPLAAKFEDAWQVLDPAPPYVKEAQVHPDRRFAYDYLWSDAKTALELQGGIYMAGKGHVGAKQFRSDCEKLNLSNVLGIVVFKLATGMVTGDNLLLLRDYILTRTKP